MCVYISVIDRHSISIHHMPPIRAIPQFIFSTNYFEPTLVLMMIGHTTALMKGVAEGEKRALGSGLSDETYYSSNFSISTFFSITNKRPSERLEKARRRWGKYAIVMDGNKRVVIVGWIWKEERIETFEMCVGEDGVAGPSNNCLWWSSIAQQKLLFVCH